MSATPSRPTERLSLHPARLRPGSWIGILSGLALVAVGAVAWSNPTRLPLPVRVGLGGLCLAGLAFLSRRGWVKLLGPVLFYDVVRTSRRSRYIILRCVYALAFLFVLYWTHQSFMRTLSMFRPMARPWMAPAPWRGPGPWGPPVVRQSDSAALAAEFFYSFMRVQFLTLLFLTPAFAASAIAEEKERKTLEFLLATDLESREIVLSKLASRLGGLALLLLTGLPILGILQFMGGVDPNLVFAGFALTGISMVSLSAVSILASVYARKPRTAIVVSYLILLAYLAVASWTSTLPAPAGLLVHVFNTGNVFAVLNTLQTKVAAGADLAHIVPGLVRDYALFHLPLAGLCCAWAVARLRSLALRQGQAAQPRPAARGGFGIRPRVGRLPVIWKELFVEPGLRLTWISGLIIAVLFVLSLFLFVGADSRFFDDLLGRQTFRSGGRAGDLWWQFRQMLHPWVRIMGTIVASLMLLGVAVRGANSISGERDRGTLDGLLTSPLQSNDILFGKWLGSLLGVRQAWLWLGLVWLVGLVTGALHPASAMLTFVAWLVYAGSLAGVGMWFSITCRTSLRATLYTLATALAAGIGHWVVWLLLLPFCSPVDARMILGLQSWITPPAVLYWLSAPFDEVGHSNEWDVHTILAGFGLFLWALVACVIWTVSRARFRRLTSRMPYLRPELAPVRAFRTGALRGVHGGDLANETL